MLTGTGDADAGRVAFRPLLARTVILLVVFTATVCAAQRALNGTWRIDTVLPVVLAGAVVLRIALKPSVRHRWHALAAFVVVVLVLGRRTDVHGDPLIWCTPAAAVVGANGISGGTPSRRAVRPSAKRTGPDRRAAAGFAPRAWRSAPARRGRTLRR